MRPLNRLLLELSGLAKTVEPAVFAQFLFAIATKSNDIRRERQLVPADREISGTIRVRRGQRTFVVPLSQMDCLLPGDSATFSGVREMYARDVYLRNAPADLKLDSVIDIGANRGMFALLAVAGLGASVVALVEMQAQYLPVWEVWRKANGLDLSYFRDFPLACSDINTEKTVSINRILDTIPRNRCDLIKMDIEGAEEQVFSRNTEWLERTRYVTAELHGATCDTSLVFKKLRSNSFDAQGYDNFGHKVSDSEANYLFARRRDV